MNVERDRTRLKIRLPNSRPRPSHGGSRKRANLIAARLSLGRILVPLDFSGKSRQALDFAVPLAERYGGKIVLAYVVQPPALSA